MSKCSVKNCPKAVIARGWCSRHYQQWNLYGGVKDIPVLSESPLKLYVGYAEVALLDRYDRLVGWSKISLEDVPLVKGKKFRSDKGRYVILTGSRLSTYLHRMIMPEAIEVDHKNNDGYDNRRENLRAATHSLNGANRAIKVGASGYKGVRKIRGRYFAHISNKTNKKSQWRSLGGYPTAKQAAEAYNKAAIEAWGEFAVLNQIV